jgi:hypothetical protein
MPTSKKDKMVIQKVTCRAMEGLQRPKTSRKDYSCYRNIILYYKRKKNILSRLSSIHKVNGLISQKKFSIFPKSSSSV